MKTFHCDFWKTPFMGFRFGLNTSATHNPIICTSKKQNARPRPAKQLQFYRKIFGGKFRARILIQLQQNKIEEEDTFSKICSKFDDKLCKKLSRNKNFPVLLTT
jgi:hypothetical protein